MSQKYTDHSQEFYFPSTQQLEQFQAFDLSLTNQFKPELAQKCSKEPQNQNLAQKYRKFNNLLLTIRQANGDLEQTIAQSKSKEQAEQLVLTKIKLNLKNFALTQNQLQYLIVLQKKYNQIKKKNQQQKDKNYPLKKKNLVQVKKPHNTHIHNKNPRTAKVNW